MYILAGPNGSGKSTILEKKIPKGIINLNADKFSREIARERGIPEDEIQYAVNNNEALQIAGLRKLRTLMRKSVEQRNTFSTETTLDLNAYKDYIKDAKSNGFEVILLYVGTQSPKINIARVSDRVIEGKHDVPPNKIVDRYYGSLDCLSGYISIVDKAQIYDNSKAGKEARHIISIDHNRITEINEPIPDWVNKSIINKLMNEEHKKAIEKGVSQEEISESKTM